MKSSADYKKAFLIAGSIAASLLSTAAVIIQLDISCYEFLTLGLVAVMYCLFSRAFCCRDRRCVVFAAVLGSVLSLLMTLGKIELLPLYGAEGDSTFLIRFIGFWAMLYAAAVFLLSRLKDVFLMTSDSRNTEAKQCRKVFLCSFILLSLVFFLWWLGEYPANITEDSNNQIQQVLGIIPLSSNHPALSTALLSIFFKSGLKLFDGNCNAAISFCALLQTLTTAAVYSYLVESLYEAGMKKTVVVGACLFYAILPTFGSMGITIWKDILFSNSITAFCVTLWRIFICFKCGKKAHTWEIVLIYVTALFAALFRNKCYYAFLLLAPFMFISFRGKSRALQYAAPIVFAAALLIDGPVYSALDIQHNDTLESVGIPIQQIAHTLTYYGASQEDMELISKVADPVCVTNLYDPISVNPLKNYIRQVGDFEYFTEHKDEFLRLWLRMGLHNPKSYLLAHIQMTRGFWYPDIPSRSMMNYCVPCEDFDIHKDSSLPERLKAELETFTSSLTSLPVIGLFSSIGTALWIALFMFTLCIIKGKKEALIVQIPIVALMLIVCLVTPVYNEFRYSFSLFTTFPLICLMPFFKGEQ